MRNYLRISPVVVALGMGAVAMAAADENLDGRWAATVVQSGATIPFRLEISGSGKNVVGTLYNGEDKETTTSASVQNGKVELDFEHYLTWITATVKDGELDGTVAISRRGAGNKPGEGEEAVATKNGKVARGAGSPFHAVRYVAPAPQDIANVPSIDGVWETGQASSTASAMR